MDSLITAAVMPDCVHGTTVHPATTPYATFKPMLMLTSTAKSSNNGPMVMLTRIALVA